MIDILGVNLILYLVVGFLGLPNGNSSQYEIEIECAISIEVSLKEYAKHYQPTQNNFYTDLKGFSHIECEVYDDYIVIALGPKEGYRGGGFYSIVDKNSFAIREFDIGR